MQVPLLSKRTSKRIAKDRLKLVLIHDRANCSPELLEMIKTDIINVISKYMEIDEESLDIKMGNTKSEISDAIVPALYANIPIKDMKKKA
ncbi:cell division topological specificity factor MinE [Vallitalea longa]|uniref:cell division topological specificity factor MinE n=1 Tax=Vallitalea longa TaxID=2936439 RepID=UPI002491BCD1|nr:cell division topological specificity factor MinE [Vallitalea longa]